jgi:hypothetical protein
MWRYANVIVNKLVPLTNFHFVLTRRAPASAYIEAAWLVSSLLIHLASSPARVRAEIRPWNSNRDQRLFLFLFVSFFFSLFAAGADNSTGRRTLRSGKEFSAFDLAVCRAISPLSTPASVSCNA